MIIALIVSNLRLMYENYLKYGMMISPSSVISIFTDKRNILFFTLTGIVIVIVVLVNFTLEWCANWINYYLFHILHIINFACLLIVPITFHKWNLIDPSNYLFKI